ncbi:MAG TPA: hypothetical protein VK971_12615 [Thiohalobacter sp.]|nr:hypothetical protein [Thiohalobacter sp.]
MEQNAFACTSLIDALEEFLDPGETLILRGTSQALREWQADCAAPCAPRRLCLAIPADAPALPAALAEKTARDGPVAYRCIGTHCSAPITDRDELKRSLSPA